MLDHKGFDLWADGYDRSVGLSDEENAYPFAGYRAVLNGIFQTVMQKPNAAVLDLGFGTGTLTAKLYENGCEVYGQDFSARMIELARAKMPDAHLYQGVFSKGLAAPLNEGGQILIGDVAFETRADLERCRLAAGDGWDDEEFYFVADELRRAVPSLTFTKISDCAGILALSV